MKGIQRLPGGRSAWGAFITTILLAQFMAATFCVSALGQAVGKQALHGQRPPAVSKLKSLGALSGTTNLQLAIGLPLRHPEELQRLLGQIYDPASPNYHHYLTPEKFAEQFGPTEKDYRAVIAFARANGLKITATHPNRMLLDVSGSVAAIERALHVTLQTYAHPAEQRTFYAPDREPSLDLSVPVLQISGLDNYARPQPHLQATPLNAASKAVLPNAGSGPSGNYLGGDFRKAYVPDSTLTGSGQVVGLLQFDGYTASDISYYESLAGLPSVTLSNVLIDGASGRPSGSGGEVEVSLDIEMAISMAPGLSKVIVYMAPNPSPWVDLLNRMATDNLAKQLSCSWYQPGGASNAVADQIFQQMAAQGQSFYNASGDYDAFTGLVPFPGDTPFLTQVGGTTLTTTGPGGAWLSETVWNRNNGIGSGGGISTQYPIPNWQTNINLTPAQGSPTLRNVPDVALTAENVYVRANGLNYNVGGTSCAAPLWAGFSALINQQALASGHPPVGFVTPAIYALGGSQNYPACFHDITTGDNTSSSSPARFYAVAGYDLCTGWGTPAGQSLINALANPEALIITPATGFTSTGGVGGPFTVTSQAFSLTNSGTNTLTWSLVSTSLWLNASPGGGTLTPNGSAATVTVSLNPAAGGLPVGTYSGTVWFTNQNDSVGQGRSFTLNVISPPLIATQPVNQSVLEGASAVFTVTATGGQPLAYQWQANGTNLTEGANVTGSTSTNLTLSNVSAANVGTYTVIVTNLAGTAVSSNASLTLTPSAPVIVMQPQSQGAVQGTSPRFAVTAIGTTPFSYQWSFNSNNIPGATNAALTLANVQFTNAGTYAVTVTNFLGSTTSSNALLSVYAVPVITAFSPRLGAGGGSVNVSGLNFDPVAGNNVVYFGAERAVVTAASATNLVVTVPVGATFAPITETVNGLTAYAPAPFLPTFSGSGAGISTASFGTRQDLSTGNGPVRVAIADLDGDGKSDLIIADAYAGKVSIYRNISTNGTLTAGSFAARLDLPLLLGSYSDPYTLAVADLDGDGRLDIIALSADSHVVSILRNISSPGSLTTNSFAARIDLPAGNAAMAVAVQDLNNDGRPEIVTADSTDNTISIYQNQSTVGNLVFAGRVVLAVGSGPQGVAIGDLDGDGKPDVAVANGGSGTLSVFRNLMAPGDSITTNSFALRVDFPGLTSACAISIGDMDGDGKLDLVVGCGNGSQKVLVYRNTATLGSITTSSFASHVDFAAPGWVNGLTLGDLDGDGKLDIAVVSQLPSDMSVFRNVSTPGSFTSASLAARVDFSTGTNPYGISVGDLDGDGRPDVVFGNVNNNTLSIYRNVVPFGTAPTINTQPTNQAVLAGSNAAFSVTASGTAPLSYRWQFNGTNIVAATNTTLSLVNVQSTNTGTYTVLVTNAYGSVLSTNAFLTLLTPPSFTNQPVSQRVSIGCNAAFSVTAGGTAPLNYQWGKGGSPLVGQTNAVLLLANVQVADFTNYFVVITNRYGSLTSSNAVLVQNHPPVAVQDLIQRLANGDVKVQVTALLTNDTDADGDTLTLIGVSTNSTAGGTVSWVGNWVYYQAPAGYTNADAFTYTISDGYCGGTATGNVLVQVMTATGPSHNFTIHIQPDGSVLLAFAGIPNWTYRIQYADTLPPVNWTDLSTNTADALGAYQFIDTPPPRCAVALLSLGVTLKRLYHESSKIFDRICLGGRRGQPAGLRRCFFFHRQSVHS